ncbi:MAG: DUF3825 domain-containing protein, partial [Clostridia bacterium]|nr:DUF3825 domain-containing protein [Clostridia bacterium]
EVDRILETIKLCIIDLQKYNEGPVLLSNLGASLKEKGFDYKEYGFEKLSHLLKEYENSLRIEYTYENQYAPPVCSVSLNSHSAANNDQSTVSGYYHPNEKPSLFTWAFLGVIDRFFDDLSTMALPEIWSFADSSKNSILKNYLSYTFLKLNAEKKIVVVDGYAAFNTGLVDKLYRPIFALFSTYKKDKYMQQNGGWEWGYRSFCVSGEGDGKLITRNFQKIPERASYLNYDRYQEFIYDFRKGQPVIDAGHIIIANLPRLPRKMIDECISVNNSLENFKFPDGRLNYAKLKVEVDHNDQILKRMYNTLKIAVEDAFNKVQWDYRMAIPIYYPKNDSISMLLPLALSDEKINLALVCEWQPKSGRYQAHTILPLDMAYKCARLINRLDSAWLSPNEIELFNTDESEMGIDD